MRSLSFALVAIALSLPATAQSASPYAGQQARGIKALSEQEADMGTRLLAEVFRYREFVDDEA